MHLLKFQCNKFFVAGIINENFLTIISNSMVALFKYGLPHILCALPKMPPPKTIAETYLQQKSPLCNNISPSNITYSFKTTKSLTGDRLQTFKNFSKLKISSHSLTTVASLEPKRSREWPPFYGTTTNSPVGCAFWGSDK